VPEDQDQPRVYEVRLTEPAEAEIDAAYLRLMGVTSLEFADRWRDDLLQAIDGLQLFPTSYPIAPESEHVPSNVRRMVHKLGRVTYVVLFALIDADGDGEADLVRVVHVRHASQLPRS
jgi:plasmid stabilization system protein ParE